MQTIAIIGAGAAGRAFARRCVQAGFAVVLEDVMPEKLRRAQDEYAELGAGMSAGTIAGSIRYASTVEEAVREADIAVDFVPDELESKLEIFSMLDRMSPPRTVLLTPTDALSITDLASCTYRPERCFAVRTGMTELVRSRFAGEAETARVEAFLRAVGVEAIVVDDALEPMLMKNLG